MVDSEVQDGTEIPYGTCVWSTGVGACCTLLQQLRMPPCVGQRPKPLQPKSRFVNTIVSSSQARLPSQQRCPLQGRPKVRGARAPAQTHVKYTATVLPSELVFPARRRARPTVAGLASGMRAGANPAVMTTFITLQTKRHGRTLVMSKLPSLIRGLKACERFETLAIAHTRTQCERFKTMGLGCRARGGGRVPEGAGAPVSGGGSGQRTRRRRQPCAGTGPPHRGPSAGFTCISA